MIKKLDVKGLPDVLEKDIDALVDAINSRKNLIDCEISEVLGSIHMSEHSCLISHQLAEELIDYYVDFGWQGEDRCIDGKAL